MNQQQTLPSSVQPTDQYGGDEVSALVLDPGYCYTRAGFAGEEYPKQFIPSFYSHVGDGDLFGDDAIIPREGLEVRNYMNRDSVVEDWDAATKHWEHVLVKRLQPLRNTGREEHPTEGDGDVAMEDADANGADEQERALAENPLLLTEAAWNTPRSREKAMEVVMENWGCPAFWLSRTPVLVAFAAGKATALVIDVGGANTSVAAVHDGLLLKRSVQKSSVGGLWLSSQIRSMLAAAEPRVEVVPRFLIESKRPVEAGSAADVRFKTYPFPIADSFRAFEDERVLTEFKEAVVEVWRGPAKLSAPVSEDHLRSVPGRVFEMPDGTNQMWREQRFRVSEGMWDEGATYPPPASTGDDTAGTGRQQTIPELIRACLNNVDVDLRGNLLNNIVVTGATTLLNGFNDRLNNELLAMYPGTRIRIHAAGLTLERRFGSWVGGSILASLGTFHQLWISRKEYEECGASIVEKRCK